MKSIIANGSGRLEIPSSSLITKMFFPIYENFNQKHFDVKFKVYKCFKKLVRKVYNFHEQECVLKIKNYEKIKVQSKSNKVVLGFSGGLDSCYQAFYLRRLGYEVVLYFVKNINSYENGQAYKYGLEFANKYGFKFVEANFVKNSSKDNPKRQYWNENPVKNQLIMSMMCDYCIDHKIKYISLGDDFGLSIENATLGVNLTDAKQITKAFLKGISRLTDNSFEFIKADRNIDKGKRLKLFKKNGCLNVYYSCLSPGRFNKSWRNKNVIKYKVDLPKNNCGSCKKCVMHWLMLRYLNLTKENKDFEEHCWNILSSKHNNAYQHIFTGNSRKENIKRLFKY